MEELFRRLRCVRVALVSRNSKFGMPIDWAELEDTIQDTLIAIWNKLDRFCGYGSLEAWCYRFCVLELRARIKQSRRRLLSATALEDSVAPKLERPAEDELELVYAGLEKLGEPESVVISMKLLDELTFDQVASRMDASPNTVRAWYYRGLRKLREHLGGQAIGVTGGGA